MKKIIIILSVFFILFFVGCGLNSKLEGTKWKSENTDLKIVTTYEFLPIDDFIIHQVPYIDNEPQWEKSTIITGKWWVEDIDKLILGYPIIEYPYSSEVGDNETYIIEYSKEKLVLSNDDETITLTRVE